MLTYEEVSKIVHGIAAKYANDNINCSHWSKEKFEEYSQELYLEAYTLLKNNPEMDKNYLAASLWNRAGEVFYKNMRVASNEQTQDWFSESVDEGYWNSTDLGKTVFEVSKDKFFLEYEEEQTNDLVCKVLELIKDRSEDIKKFVIARLKLTGYIPMDSYPEVVVDPKEFESADITENHKILKDVLNMNGASSGGTNKFKDAKRSLFLDLISEFEVEDCYRRWFVVEYVSTSGNIKIERVKKYNQKEVEDHVYSLEDFKEIKSIFLEE